MRVVWRSAVIASERIVAAAGKGNRAALSLLKLDMGERCRHTRRTVSRPVRMLELVSPSSAQLVALGMLIVIVILILPL